MGGTREKGKDEGGKEKLAPIRSTSEKAKLIGR